MYAFHRSLKETIFSTIISIKTMGLQAVITWVPLLAVHWYLPLSSLPTPDIVKTLDGAGVSEYRSSVKASTTMHTKLV